MNEQEKIRKFKEFHFKNPEVYKEFKKFILEMHEKTGKMSGRLAYERARWEVYINTSDEDYKMNNNYVPAYIRLFLKECPQYVDVISTRKSVFDNEI